MDEAEGETRGPAGPERTCVGCRERAPAAGLLRVVVRGTDLVPDPRRRLPGRGASLHLDEECLTSAERRRAFTRALRVPGPLDLGTVREHVRAETARRRGQAENS
ncbi:MAG: YlxR family protein [Mycobacteriaceae bacterium]